jgi:hypothetical protein
MRDTGEKLRPVTVNLGEPERRALLVEASRRTLELGRPVSVSQVARELLREAVAHRGEAA